MKDKRGEEAAEEKFEALRRKLNEVEWNWKKEAIFITKVQSEAASYPEDLVNIIYKGYYTKQQMFNVDNTAFCWKKVIAGEQKLPPGFTTSQNILTLFLGANAAGDFSQCSFIIPKTLGFLRIMLNWLCPCFIHAMAKPGWWHVCWQHGWLNVLRPLMRNLPEIQSIFRWSTWVR